MSDEDPKPVGALGAAFASLAEDMPETSLSPWRVIGEARQRRSRRRTVVTGVAAALAGVSVLTALIVYGPGSSSSTSSATSAGAAAALAPPSEPAALGGAQLNAESAPEGAPSPVSRAADSASSGGVTPTSAAPAASTATGSATSGQPPATGGCASMPLSAAQDRLVHQFLGDLQSAELSCIPDLPADVVGYGRYPASGSSPQPQVVVTLTNDAVDYCGLPAGSCAEVPGHPGVLTGRAAFGSAADTGGQVVYLTGAAGTVAITSGPGSGSRYSLDVLAGLVEALLPTL